MLYFLCCYISNGISYFNSLFGAPMEKDKLDLLLILSRVIFSSFVPSTLFFNLHLCDRSCCSLLLPVLPISSLQLLSTFGFVHPFCCFCLRICHQCFNLVLFWWNIIPLPSLNHICITWLICIIFILSHLSMVFLGSMVDPCSDIFCHDHIQVHGLLQWALSLWSVGRVWCLKSYLNKWWWWDSFQNGILMI